VDDAGCKPRQAIRWAAIQIDQHRHRTGCAQRLAPLLGRCGGEDPEASVQPCDNSEPDVPASDDQQARFAEACAPVQRPGG
jgi:hypothetical protein